MDLLICLVKLPKRRQTEEVIASRRNPDPEYLMGVSEREVKSESQRRRVSKAKALNNITCSDDKAGTLIVPVPSLAPGASTTVTGSYVPTTSPSTDTLTCIGTGEISNKSVSSSGSATCNTRSGGGCTLTFGYWKTHSKYGPAPYDDLWAFIGEDTPFFLSGKSWYQVLWNSPKGGNAYYILAHQYIAATLNTLNKTSSTQQVNEALAWAKESFFNNYTPSLNLTSNVRNQALFYADLLDQYNNGLIGPGHCSE
jgi:hypothetical protein